VIIVPVGSSSAPTKSDYEVARVVPVGSESSCALVGLEVCKVAIVVLNIVDGLTLLELVLCRSSKRRSHGRAEKSEKSRSELHVVRMMMIEEEWDGMMCVMDSRDLGALALLPYYTRQPGVTPMTRLGAIQPEKAIELKLKHQGANLTQAIHKPDKLVLSLGHGAWLRIQPV
jgi:hypothetical protein